MGCLNKLKDFLCGKEEVEKPASPEEANRILIKEWQDQAVFDLEDFTYRRIHKLLSYTHDSRTGTIRYIGYPNFRE
jgi:hypothetical protein